MSYSEFMAETIKKSGYSLRQLAGICERKYNQKITASYLSKLQTGGQTPASDDVNIAIARACGIDPEDILFEARLERAPEEVKELVDVLIKQIKGMYIELGKNAIVKKFDTKNDLEKFINMSTRNFVKAMTKEKELMINPLELAAPIKNNTTGEKISEVFAKLSVGVKMLDSSMFPIIQEGAKLELDSAETVKNGDVVSVLLIGENKTLIRTFIKNNHTITLVPANKNFETLILKEKDIKINGKVKSITVDL